MQDVVGSLGSASVYSTSCFFGESEEQKKEKIDVNLLSETLSSLYFVFYSINV